MKTIKEAAIDYTESKYMDSNEDAFIAGAEFTQRWIPVDEELPEVNELVQVQIQEFLGGAIYFDHDKVIEVENNQKMFDCEQCAVKVIAWRLIEYK